MPDFSLEALAKYLHLSPPQVARLADRGKLPGRKVAGHWRFARADVHHWLEGRIGLADEDDVVDVQRVLRRTDAEEEISIGEMLRMESIGIPLAAKTRNSVFSAMVDLAERTSLLWDRVKMIEAVHAREDMMPTAMENGVALLHPRRPMASILAEPLLALGISPSGVPFGGNRGALTDMFFLICSVDDRGHLRTLARLSRLLTQPGFLASLRAATDPASAHRLIVETEAGLASR